MYFQEISTKSYLNPSGYHFETVESNELPECYLKALKHSRKSRKFHNTFTRTPAKRNLDIRKESQTPFLEFRSHCYY